MAEKLSFYWRKTKKKEGNKEFNEWEGGRSVHFNVGIAKDNLVTKQAASHQHNQLLCNRRSCSTAISMAELLGRGRTSDPSARVGDGERQVMGFPVFLAPEHIHDTPGEEKV